MPEGNSSRMTGEVSLLEAEQAGLWLSSAPPVIRMTCAAGGKRDSHSWTDDAVQYPLPPPQLLSSPPMPSMKPARFFR